MKGLARRFEKLMMAVAFAEAGEHETAREIMKQNDTDTKSDRKTPPKRPDRTMRASAGRQP